MNNNNLNEGTKYRATRNLNTALETPQLNVNDTLDVNIQNVNNNNYVKENDYANLNSNIYNAGVNNNSLSSSEFGNNSFISNQTGIDSYNNFENQVETNPNIYNDNSFINNSIVNVEDNNKDYNMFNNISSNDDNLTSVSSDNNNDKITYTPTVEPKKKKISFKISPELRILIILISILLLFILVMPNIYDVVNDIRLAIFGKR